MPGGLVFRAATMADLAHVVALWQRCGLTVAHNPPEADFERAVSSGSSEIILAESGNRLLGCVMVGDDGHRAVVYYLGVDPLERKTGLGRRLMAQAEAWARTRGARKLNLMIREDNTGVRAFYEAAGYEVTPRLVMAKWLDK